MTEDQIQAYLEKIETVIKNGKYKADWNSLSQYGVPKWYSNAKFGIFIHWGIYSVPAFFSEWYCRMMYYKGNPTYWHHIRKYGKTLITVILSPCLKLKNSTRMFG